MPTLPSLPSLERDPDLRPRFEELFGHAPAVVARAPGRVNLVGEHTDYHGGLCLPIALDQATWVAAAPRDDDLVEVVSAAEARPWRGRAGDRGEGWAKYVTSALAAVGHSGGVDLLVDSSVPVGAGLSSSAALICAVATALSDLSPAELVGPCVRAEVEGVGAATGGLDQTVSLLARPGHALLLDFGAGTPEHVPWRPEDAGLELLVVDTRTRHAHAAGEYRRRRAESEAALAGDPDRLDPLLARRRRHVETENARVLQVVSALARDDWETVGNAFTASHASLRDDYEVSAPELDAVVDSALGAGALGARMTGGGFGGCAIVLLPAEAREPVVAALREAYRSRSWDEPVWWVAHAAGPAVRLAPPD